MSPVHRPETVDEALELLGSRGEDAAPLAGGTWIMRAPLRQERLRRQYVALGGLRELGGTGAQDGAVRIGALATHATIAEVERGTGPLGALTEAARRSAFPAVRNVATLGGNLASRFPEADLVPPLLAADAVLELASPGGRETMSVAAYLEGRAPRDALLVGARIPAPERRRSWFERLTVRSAAEYSVASVAISLDLSEDLTIEAARIAVGSVQDRPTRIEQAEAALLGARLEDHVIQSTGAAAAEALRGRDGLDAPGWYRVAVLRPLVARALGRLAHEEER